MRDKLTHLPPDNTLITPFIKTLWRPWIHFHSNLWFYFAIKSKSLTYGTNWYASLSVAAHNMPLLMRSSESPTDHKDTVAVMMATGNNGSLFSRPPSFHSPVYTRNKIAIETEEWWRQNGGGLGTRQWCKHFTAHNTTFTDPLHFQFNESNFSGCS